MPSSSLVQINAYHSFFQMNAYLSFFYMNALLSVYMNLLLCTLPIYKFKCTMSSATLIWNVLTNFSCFQFEKETLTKDVEGGRVDKNSKATIFRVMSLIVIQAFTLTFIAEWGDRSQLATFLLAAKDVSTRFEWYVLYSIWLKRMGIVKIEGGGGSLHFLLPVIFLF